MFDLNKFLDEQTRWIDKQINELDKAQSNRLNRAYEHYTTVLKEIGFPNFRLNLSHDNFLQNLDFTYEDRHGLSSVSCRCSGDADIIYFYVPEDIEDMLVAIKSVDHVGKEDYATHLIYGLKNKGFSSIRHDYRIGDTVCKLRLTAKKMDHRYELDVTKPSRRFTINRGRERALCTDFDTMDGYQFENFCAQLLSKRGYEDVLVTQGSGDQGIDIIAYKDGIKYGIQCKCYSSAVGNKAVQEAFSGKAFYQCHVGIVITNNYFTDSAIELARQNGIVLWNRDKLTQMLTEGK